MKFLKIFLISCLFLLFIPLKSYALFIPFDFSAYGDITFNNKIDATKATKAHGFGFGFTGHYRKTVIPFLLSFGIGGYYDRNSLTFDKISTDFDYNKQSAGLDLYAMIELPVFIHPFFRASLAVWEDLNNHTEYFQSFAFGPGLGFNFAIIQIYLEYMYSSSWHDENRAEGHTLNLGLRIFL